jgi:hypothetical protein
MKKDFGALPDAEKHPPATAITPGAIADSEKEVRFLRITGTAEQIAEAEAEHQALCQTQNDQLRAIAMQRQFQQLTRNSHEQ